MYELNMFFSEARNNLNHSALIMYQNSIAFSTNIEVVFKKQLKKYEQSVDQVFVARFYTLYIYTV